MELLEDNSLPTEQRLALIANHPFFALLSKADVAELNQLMKAHVICAGETIVKEGENINNIYLVAKGEAEVTRHISTLEKSVDIPHAVLHHGDAIGLSDEGFFSQQGRRTATVVALTKMVLLVIELPEFNKFMQAPTRLYPGLREQAEKMLRINFIKNAAPFTKMNIDDVYWLASKLQEIIIPANTIIFKEGDPGDKCYLIKSGKVEILRKKNDTEKNAVIATLQPPAIFGETALITGLPRNATARTSENSQLLTIDYKLLKEIFKRDKETAKNLKNISENRTIPIKVHEPVIFPHENVLGDAYLTLKNDKDHRYCVIPHAGWLVWEQIDGKKSIAEIVDACKQKFNDKTEDIVHDALQNLAKAGLIIFPKTDITLSTSWLQRLLQKLHLAKK